MAERRPEPSTPNPPYSRAQGADPCRARRDEVVPLHSKVVSLSKHCLSVPGRSEPGIWPWACSQARLAGSGGRPLRPVPRAPPPRPQVSSALSGLGRASFSHRMWPSGWLRPPPHPLWALSRPKAEERMTPPSVPQATAHSSSGPSCLPHPLPGKPVLSSLRSWGSPNGLQAPSQVRGPVGWPASPSWVPPPCNRPPSKGLSADNQGTDSEKRREKRHSGARQDPYLLGRNVRGSRAGSPAAQAQPSQPRRGGERRGRGSGPAGGRGGLCQEPGRETGGNPPAGEGSWVPYPAPTMGPALRMGLPRPQHTSWRRGQGP